MIWLPVTDLPAQFPLSPDAGVLAGIVLTPCTTETSPFIGCFVMVTVFGKALQLRSQDREYAMPLSTPDFAERVSLSSAPSAASANVTKRVWKIGDVVDVLEAWEPFGAREQESGGLRLRHGLFCAADRSRCHPTSGFGGYG
jgi:hypothetical protein